MLNIKKNYEKANTSIGGKDVQGWRRVKNVPGNFKQTWQEKTNRLTGKAAFESGAEGLVQAHTWKRVFLDRKHDMQSIWYGSWKNSRVAPPSKEGYMVLSKTDGISGGNTDLGFWGLHLLCVSTRQVLSDDVETPHGGTTLKSVGSS